MTLRERNTHLLSSKYNSTTKREILQTTIFAMKMKGLENGIHLKTYVSFWQKIYRNTIIAISPMDIIESNNLTRFILLRRKSLKPKTSSEKGETQTQDHSSPLNLLSVP
jgi:prephenate dehydratase